MIKFYLKALLFLLLLLGLLWSIDSFFLRSTNEKVASVQSIYDGDNYDILFVGDSHISSAIQPQIIDAKLNANSTVIYGGEVNIVEVYYNILESLEYHSPELIVLETFPISSPSESKNILFENGNLMASNWKNYHNKNFGRIKLEEVSSIKNPNRLYQMFNVFRYHKRWIDMTGWSKDISAKLANTARQNYILSPQYSSSLTASKYREYESTEFSNELIFISEKEREYLKKIIEITQERNIKLLLVTVPTLDEYYRKTKVGLDIFNHQLDTILSQYPKVKHWNLNKELGGFGRTKIMNEKKVSSNQHLNYGGSVAFSNQIANYIKLNFKGDYKTSFNNVTAEEILYSNLKLKRIDDMHGKVVSLNGTPVKDYESFPDLKLSTNKNKIQLVGWIYKDGIDNDNATKRIALKKNDNFIFITRHETKSKNSSFLKGKFETECSNCGYEFNVNKESLGPGRYEIYHILETKKGLVFVQDMQKWIVIE